MTRTIEDTNVAGYRDCLGVVARERIYLGLVDAPELEAQRLYRRFGFMVEGVKRNARKLDGRYDDHILMARQLGGRITR